MPAGDIRSYLPEVKLSNLGRVKSFWKVSIKSLIKRAHDMKLITDNYYKVLNIQYNKSFKDGEPFDVPLEQPYAMKDIVEYHSRCLGYTIRDLSNLLNMNEDDVRRAYIEGPRLRLVVSN